MNNINIQDYLDPQLESGKEEPEEIIGAESWTPLDLHIPVLGLALLLILVLLCAIYYFGFLYIIRVPPFGAVSVPTIVP